MDDDDVPAEWLASLASFGGSLRRLNSAFSVLGMSISEGIDELRDQPTPAREIGEAVIARAMRTPPSEG